MSCAKGHLAECIDGVWEEAGFNTVRRGGEFIKVQVVAPCNHCRPGRRAVWARKMDHVVHPSGWRQSTAWNRDKVAMAVYGEAEGEDS